MDEGTRLDEGTMLHWLGQAARDARERAGRLQVHVAASLGVAQITVGRFERGERWPRDIDEMLAAYADDLEIDPREIWADALARWKAHGTAATLTDLRDD